jgi:hypothetical protein
VRAWERAVSESSRDQRVRAFATLFAHTDRFSQTLQGELADINTMQDKLNTHVDVSEVAASAHTHTHTHTRKDICIHKNMCL